MFAVCEENKEYITTIETSSLNGKSYTIINEHPVLDQDEKERRHQDFLKVAARILAKYNIK